MQAKKRFSVSPGMLPGTSSDWTMSLSEAFPCFTISADRRSFFTANGKEKIACIAFSLPLVNAFCYFQFLASLQQLRGADFIKIHRQRVVCLTGKRSCTRLIAIFLLRVSIISPGPHPAFFIGKMRRVLNVVPGQIRQNNSYFPSWSASCYLNKNIFQSKDCELNGFRLQERKMG